MHMCAQMCWEYVYLLFILEKEPVSGSLVYVYFLCDLLLISFLSFCFFVFLFYHTDFSHFHTH